MVLAAPVGTSSLPSETLHYSVNWPSGLSLGEAQLSASNARPSADQAPRLHFTFDLDASIPGFSVSDRYRSETSDDFCAAEFDRKFTHGKKRVDDKTSFDPREGTATRVNAGGGKAVVEASSCSRDALSFIYFVRQELSQGRFPPPQTVFFGVPYDIRLDFAGTETLRIGDSQQQADKFAAKVTGPSSNLSFEIFFLKDRAHTLALARVPFAMGTFSLELVK